MLKTKLWGWASCKVFRESSPPNLLFTFGIFRGRKWGKNLICLLACSRVQFFHRFHQDKVFQPLHNNTLMPAKGIIKNSTSLAPANSEDERRIKFNFKSRKIRFRWRKKDFPMSKLCVCEFHRSVKTGAWKKKLFFDVCQLEFFVLFTWWNIDLCSRFTSDSAACFAHVVVSVGWDCFCLFYLFHISSAGWTDARAQERAEI